MFNRTKRDQEEKKPRPKPKAARTKVIKPFGNPKLGREFLKDKPYRMLASLEYNSGVWEVHLPMKLAKNFAV